MHRRTLDFDTTASGIGWGLLAAMCWATSTTLARFGTVSGVSSLDMTVLRFATSGFVLMPYVLARRADRKAARIGWGRALALTIAAGPPYAFLVADGFRFAPLVHGAILFPVSTSLAAILFGVLLLGEPFGWRGIVGTFILVAGLVLVLHQDSGDPTGGPVWIGDAMFVAAGATFGLYGYLLRRWRIGAWPAASVVAVSSLVFCVAIALLMPDRILANVSMRDLAVQVAAQGLGAGVIATVAFSKAVHRLGSAQAGLFAAIVPVLALLIGIPLVRELPSPTQGAGLVLVTAGLVLALFNSGTRTAPRSTPKDTPQCNS